MTLVFGMKLASATPILLTFDWTGQCDDCQNSAGAIDVPGFFMGDGYTQDVSGLLTVTYDPSLGQFEFDSFVYNGSSILHKAEASGYFNVDISSAFTIVGNSVEVTGGLSLATHGFSYKGSFDDLKQYDTHPIYGVVDRVNRVMAFDGSGDFRLAVNYSWITYVEPDVCIGDCGGGGSGGGRSSGSRDIGYDSKFVMRGNLPSPLANPVPEPSTIALFALGVLGLSLRRKKCA